MKRQWPRPNLFKRIGDWMDLRPLNKNDKRVRNIDARERLARTGVPR
jgi:hypothetical protein